MRFVLIFLIVALVIKDITLIGDPYFLRIVSQGLCLVVGSIWLCGHLNLSLFKRYWPIFGYLMSLMLTVLVTNETVYVLLQVVSLTAVILFFIAYFESRADHPEASGKNFIITTVFSYSFICMLSLFAIFFFPDYAYEKIFFNEIRFRGVYSKSALIGSAAGVLIVFTLFGIRSAWGKVLPLACGCVCLALTLTRATWVGCFLAITITVWFYYPRRRIFMASGAAVIAFIAACMFVFNFSPDSGTLTNVKQVLRVGSISTLNGRTKIWSDGFTAALTAPLLGHGFTTGGKAFQINAHRKNISDIALADNDSFLSFDKSRSIGMSTLHNGIIQSLLDAGIIGTFFYITVMVMSFRYLILCDRMRSHPAEFACLLFLLISNLAQNVIYSAANFDSILFWCLAVFALSLDRRERGKAGCPLDSRACIGYSGLSAAK